jgi:hypothetical protein
MADKTQTFSITPAQYQTLAAKAQAAGVPISGDTGTATKDGVTVSWAYSGNSLGITIENREWFDPSVASLQQKITDLVTEATS